MKKLFILLLATLHWPLATLAMPPFQAAIPGLVFWEPSNEGAGTNISDASGFSNNLTSTNGAALTWTNGARGNSGGPPGGAVWFNGSSQDAWTPDNASLDFAGTGVPITIGAWVWWHSSALSYSAVVAKESNNGGFTMLLKSNQKVAFYLSSGSSVFQDGTSGTVALNSWQHVCCVYDGTNISTYINGTLSSQTQPASATWTNCPGALILGNSQNTPTRWFNGAITKCFISTNWLTSNQVAQIYGAGYGCERP